MENVSFKSLFRSKDKIIIKEASKVLDNNGIIKVYLIFREVNKQKDYYINYQTLIG